MWVLVALAIYFWPWVLGGAAAALILWWPTNLLRLAQAAVDEREAQRAALIARADQQHP
jgi:hypothetical protein